MTVRKEATVEHGVSQEEIARAVKTTLESLWGCAEKSPGVFESDISISLWSFGERFTVDVTEKGVIEIGSESKLPTTLVDWGKNRGNITKFLGALKGELAMGGLAESKPEAYSSLVATENTQVRDTSSRQEGLSTIFLIAIIAGVLIIIAFACIVVYLAVAFFVSLL